MLYIVAFQQKIKQKKNVLFDCRHPSSIRDAKIAASERVKSGVTDERLWLQINEPTEKDKGKYTIDLFDGKDGIRRVFDLSGQGEQSQSIDFRSYKLWCVASLD